MNAEGNKRNLTSRPSMEVEEIMGQVPRSLVRYGISLITLALILITGLSWFIKYPDVVKARAEITTMNPPLRIRSPIAGKILQIRVKDSAMVDSGQVLVVIGEGNGIKDLEPWHQHVRKLYSAIRSDSLWLIPMIGPAGDLELSVLQGYASDVSASLKDYISLLEKERRFDQPKAEALHRRVREQDALIASLRRQIDLLKEESNIVGKDYQRDSSLYLSGGISESEFETSRKRVLQHDMQIEDARARLAEVVIQKGNYQQQLTDFIINAEEDVQDALMELEKALGQALGAYSDWEEKHIALSPKAGRLSLNSSWKTGQEVAVDEMLMTVIPEDQGDYVAKLYLDLRGSGLVEKGAEVRISLTDYPVMEYGVLNGKISRISALPEEGYLLAEVALHHGLTTSYDKALDFRGSLSGEAEVITRDARLLERIVRPLRYIIQHEVKK